MCRKFIQAYNLEREKIKIRECGENSDMSCELMIDIYLLCKIPPTCITF